VLSRVRPRLAAAWVAAALAGPLLAAPADEGFRRFASELGQGEPLMRIGLEAGHSVELSSSRPFRVVDPATGRSTWRERFEGTIHVVAEGGPVQGVPTVYRVQVGAYGSEEAARRELARLQRELGESAGVVHHDPDRGNWRVRLGQARDRLALGPLTDALRERGVTDFWIASEPLVAASGVKLRLVDASYESHATELQRLAVLPTPGHLIEVNGSPYRGVVEIRITAFGTLRAINWIELETYLLGVVPAELGPEVYPQMHALQAQAVAARTYAWRNRGQFEEEGYDLCATPRCQVYKGRRVEHPMTDRAVAVTRGEILTWKGEPISALYTSTCGGHTEDGKEVFADHDEPYLAGVPCRAENEALATLRGTLQGRPIRPLRDETGFDVTRDWSLLQAAGVVATETKPAAAVAPLTPAGLRAMTRPLSGLAGLPEPAAEPAPFDNLGQAATALLADLGWAERAELLLDDADLPALLRDSRSAGLPPDQARALAYLAGSEALHPFDDGSFHVERVPSAARLVPALVRVGGTYRAFGLREAVVSGLGQSSVRLVRGKGEVRLPVARGPYLFTRAGGRSVPAERLELWPGDRVRYRLDGAGAIDFLELVPPVRGVSDDRSSRVYSWEVRRSRRELEAMINARVAIGTLTQLKVLRRGVSGRVAELEVGGTEGKTVIRGFDVRRILDLRESLAVMEIQRDARGRITAVVFAGKGWGHGVGLCQVGAYGMALRGSTYREILGHYYSGVQLSRIR